MGADQDLLSMAGACLCVGHVRYLSVTIIYSPSASHNKRRPGKNTEAERALLRLRQKLQGFEYGEALSVCASYRQLICYPSSIYLLLCFVAVHTGFVRTGARPSQSTDH